jgi:hypothetical protein
MQHVITGGRNSQFSIEHAFASLSEFFALLVFLSVTLALEPISAALVLKPKHAEHRNDFNHRTENPSS